MKQLFPILLDVCHSDVPRIHPRKAPDLCQVSQPRHIQNYYMFFNQHFILNELEKGLSCELC